MHCIKMHGCASSDIVCNREKDNSVSYRASKVPSFWWAYLIVF